MISAGQTIDGQSESICHARPTAYAVQADARKGNDGGDYLDGAEGFELLTDQESQQVRELYKTRVKLNLFTHI
jgi:hypothetical protein